MIYLTALLAALIGLALGTLGGGGSVLAVPLLIYVAGLSDKTAIATSLLVVGATSAVAALGHAHAGNVRWRGALMFTPSAMLGAYVGGRLSQLAGAGRRDSVPEDAADAFRPPPPAPRLELETCQRATPGGRQG